MQTNTKQIEEQLRIKRIARKEIRQMRSVLSEQGGSKVKEAFLDIFRALRLAAMDVSNSLRLTLGIIFTFDPNKIEKKIEAFDTRRQKINAEWAPIVSRAKEAFDNADPILTMAVMGPANFLTAQGIGAGLAAGKTAAEIIAAKNWNEIVNSFDVTLDVNQSLQQFFQRYSRNEEKRQREELEDVQSGGTRRADGILGRLSRIFSEGQETEGQVILEQKSQDTPGGSMFTPEQASSIFVKATGMDKEFEKIRKASLENLKETMASIKGQIDPMRSSAQLFAATDFESFKNAFESAKSQNPKIDITALKKFSDVLSKETEKLSKDPKFAEEIKKQIANSGKSAVQLTPDQIKVEANKKVFQVSKEQFDKQLADGLKNAVSSTESAINKLNIDDDVLKNLKKSPYKDANEVAKIYEELLSVYKEIKNDFESKAKSKVTK